MEKLGSLISIHGVVPKPPGPVPVLRVLIVQAQTVIDVGHPSTIIVPLTRNLIDEAEPLRIRVIATHSLRHDSDLLIDQIRVIDNSRLMGAPLAQLGDPLMRSVGEALREVLDLG